MANMFGQFANASLKIADKSNELLARQQLINVKDELRELGYNADSGYFLTRGQQTLDQRKEVQDRAEDIIRKGLMGVNANARQKLFPSLMAEREAFLNNMSQYASAQHKVWEEDVKKRELNMPVLSIRCGKKMLRNENYKILLKRFLNLIMILFYTRTQ
jgi:hypothetical protein